MSNDLFDTADNAVETKPEFSTWGECFVEMFEAVWPKGEGLQRFDPTIHKAADKFVRIEIAVIPLDEMNARFNAEFKGNVTGWNNRDWAAVTLPSIKALGIGARDIVGKWVKVTKKPNGKTYEKKKDGVKTGEKGDLTDFLFMKVFASQDACLADYLATRAGDPQTEESADAFPVSEPAPQPIPSAQPTGPNDDILRKFANAIVTSAAKQANKDMAQTLAIAGPQLAANPMLKGKFGPDSADVLEMITEACK
jgi:hypothetical protein